MITIVGATGNTGSVAAAALLARGEKVRAVGRRPERLQKLAEQGAEIFTGDVLDTAAMTKAFTGARAVYLMIPPDFTQADFRGYQARVADSLARAIEASGVTHAVTLSSVGAHLSEGAGPISGLHHFEQRINQVRGLNVLHLRPGYFFENFLMQIGAIRQFGMMGGSMRGDLAVAMIATRDIGIRAAEELARRSFTGQQTRELLGPRDVSLAEAAAILGKAIGKPDLRYQQMPYEQFESILTRMGLSPDGARLINEMYRAFNEGRVVAQEKRGPENTTSTTLEQWATEVFVPAFRGQAAGA
ncbi:MAG: NAD(P)H-binding protein [Acidobacteriia bacterium]|jgi:uncharacterized protein YbjT (DUF2867 family)|nr:NAD(P)H-binding protein [Terriglobia bacterium]